MPSSENSKNSKTLSSRVPPRVSSHISSRMPVLFIGHGSPENAMADNEFTRAWREIAWIIPEPKAIVCISAHWVTDGSSAGGGSRVTAMEHPKTIHDFYGFQKELYEIQYPAKGSSVLAKQIADLTGAVLDEEWGLDHGAWSVLRVMYPKADIPVLQLSISERLSTREHVALGRKIRELRDDGVLIIGSGNIVHNLGMMRPGDHPAYTWARAFDEYVAEALRKRDDASIMSYANHPAARQAHPSSEHYLPLLYVIGALYENETPKFFCEKFVYSSLSMRCVLFGKE